MDSKSSLTRAKLISPLLHRHLRAHFEFQFRRPLSSLHLPQQTKKHHRSLLSSSSSSQLQQQQQHTAATTRSYSHTGGWEAEAATTSQTSRPKPLQVVLFSPQIPGNTGCIARTCAASAVGLHLVEPLGFQVDDSKLKRAGLDYWPYVVVKIHGSWAEFTNYFSQQKGEKRLLAFTKRGKATHSEFSYRQGDWLVFGSETSGLPPEVLFDCASGNFGGGTLRIPMVETYVRCLNLSVSVGIALYEASRQLNYEQLQYSSEGCIDNQGSFFLEDKFA